jgi:hypothetical protein
MACILSFCLAPALLGCDLLPPGAYEVTELVVLGGAAEHVARRPGTPSNGGWAVTGNTWV